MRLLLVEDEPRLAAGLKRGLEANGFTVDHAADGIAGLALARRGDHDLVILDLMLPGMNGYKICSTLRAEGNDVPILVLTAKDGELDEAESLDSGADDHITKPFSQVVLLARIRALLRRDRGTGDPVLRAGDLALDPVARRCRRGSLEIGLTPRELALLEFLLLRKNTVVSKDDILYHVWNGEFEGDPNIVEVYIGRLRHKLDKPFGTMTITTVRGAGYRVDDDVG